ncbi:MAG: hypothetical protein IJ060_00750 [Oscillospiraceae bacterium]|nr:hypothetical protein [Oscillospiraceae bacterium]
MKKRTLTALGCALCLLLTACGDKSSTDAASSITEDTTASTAQTTDGTADTTASDTEAGTTGTEQTSGAGQTFGDGQSAELPGDTTGAPATDPPSGGGNTGGGNTGSGNAGGGNTGVRYGSEKLFDTPEEATRNTIAAWNAADADLLLKGLSPRIVEGLAGSYGKTPAEVYEACKARFAEEKDDPEREGTGMTVTATLKPEELNNETDPDNVRDYCNQIYDVLADYGYDPDKLTYVVLELHMLYFSPDGIVVDERDVMEPVFHIDEGWLDLWAPAAVEEIIEE